MGSQARSQAFMRRARGEGWPRQGDRNAGKDTWRAGSPPKIPLPPRLPHLARAAPVRVEKGDIVQSQDDLVGARDHLDVK